MRGDRGVGKAEIGRVQQQEPAGPQAARKIGDLALEVSELQVRIAALRAARGQIPETQDARQKIAS